MLRKPYSNIQPNSSYSLKEIFVKSDDLGESKFSVTKATLELQMSVCPSVCPLVSLSVINSSKCLYWAYWPSCLLTILPIDHWTWAYRPLSLLTIEPTDHRAYWPLSLSTIQPIDHWAYRPSSLSTIEHIDLWSSFATFKPFGLFRCIEDCFFILSSADMFVRIWGNINIRDFNICLGSRL